jgi:hypothetical protein
MMATVRALPALYAYHILDEPNAAQSPRWAG